MSKHLGTVATMACMKTLLMLFNFVLWASGMLMLGVGIWMRIHLRDYIDLNLDGGVFLALACLGGILSLAALFACCCTARGHPALLYLYGAFLAVVALLELGAGATVYAYQQCLRTHLSEGFEQNLNDSMRVYGEDRAKTERIDNMQSTLQCCGSKSYTDWLNMDPPRDIPFSCCNDSKDTCDTNYTNQIYVKGCYNRVLELVNCYLGVAVWTAIGVAFFPFVLGVLLACCLASNINKVKYEQVA